MEVIMAFKVERNNNVMIKLKAIVGDFFDPLINKIFQIESDAGRIPIVSDVPMDKEDIHKP
jgi:hypothetical protein